MIPTHTETEALTFEVTKNNSLKAKPLRSKKDTRTILAELGIDTVV